MNLKDKVVLITGSTRGIGKAIAESFAAEGATTIIFGRNEERAKAVSDEIQKNGGKSDYYTGDVTNLENIQEIANKILDNHTRLDILINNAGITKDNLLLRMSETDWLDVMNINLRGVFNCTKIFSKVMLKAKHGKIINISSISGIKGNAGQANYAASKAGIIGFTKSIAKEFASRGITANAVAPGYIATNMTADLIDKAREKILAEIPMRKFGSAKDVAETCLFLASNGADYITGQTIIVDGGMAIN